MNKNFNTSETLSSSNNGRNVFYVYNELLVSLCSKIPNVKNRANVVHSLIKSYNLLECMKVIDVIPATTENLCQFHSPLYIEFLNNISNINEDDVPDKVTFDASFVNEDFGIGYDCPIIDHISTLVSLIAGSSISAAKKLCQNSADIAINWFGGWHHAQRDQAEGFCYVNDVVLAIEELRIIFGKVFYIDLDIHHGNGVENAYNFTSKVFTLSFHKYESGFYPGTGSKNDIGISKGKYYTVNVPLKEGISDISYCYLFKRITDEILTTYKPNAIVIQCGADGLTGDRLGGFNLTLTTFNYSLKKVLSWNKPTLILGGGGYNKANVARCWTSLTSVAIGRVLSNNIPDNEYFYEFGPDFTLQITASNRKDDNTRDYLNSILNQIIGNIQQNVKSK